MKHCVKKLIVFIVIVSFFVPLSGGPSTAQAASRITLKNGAYAPTTVYTGHSYDLKVAGQKVKFYSGDKTVATIGLSTGILKAVAPGTVTITAKSVKSGKVVATKTFTVLARATSVAVNSTEVYLNVNDTFPLKATLTPANSTDVVRFISQDKSIATVGLTAGKITAKKEGKTTIQVLAKATKATANSSINNIVATVDVYVGAYLDRVEQISTTKFLLTFKTGVKDIKASDITIINMTTKATVVVKNAEVDAANPKKVWVETFADVKDGKEYEVSYRSTSQCFAATDGKPASISVEPVWVEVNKPTPLYVVLRDENGIEIKRYSREKDKEDDKISIIDVSNINDGKVTLASQDDKAQVKAIYHTYKYENGKEVGALETTVEIQAYDAGKTQSVVEYSISDTAFEFDKAGAVPYHYLYPGDNSYIYFRIKNKNGEEVSDYSGYTVSFSGSQGLLELASDRIDGETHRIGVSCKGFGTGGLVIRNSRGKLVAYCPLFTESKNYVQTPTRMVLSEETITMSNYAQVFNNTYDSVKDIAVQILDQDGNAMEYDKKKLTVKPAFTSDGLQDFVTIQENGIRINALQVPAGDSYRYAVAYDGVVYKTLKITVKGPVISMERRTDYRFGSASGDDGAVNLPTVIQNAYWFRCNGLLLSEYITKIEDYSVAESTDTYIELASVTYRIYYDNMSSYFTCYVNDRSVLGRIYSAKYPGSILIGSGNCVELSGTNEQIFYVPLSVRDTWGNQMEIDLSEILLTQRNTSVPTTLEVCEYDAEDGMMQVRLHNGDNQPRTISYQVTVRGVTAYFTLKITPPTEEPPAEL